MRCFRKLLGISYRDHITNEEVKARIGNAIGPYEDLLTTVKRRKLKWYGHITRSSGLAKTILQGTVQGGRRRGRQRKRWEDSIKEWTGLPWNITLRKAENREEWRKLVVKSPVVPQRQPDYGIDKKIRTCYSISGTDLLNVPATCYSISGTDLLNVPATCYSISGTDLLRQLYLLPH